MTYKVESQCKHQRKSRNLQQRASDAMANKPDSAAHDHLMSLNADLGHKLAFESDEQVHGNVRSRSSPASITHHFCAEAQLMPQHYPSQKPMEGSAATRDSRSLHYDKVAPLAGGAGYNHARSWASTR
jgi:hypothetical protein